MNKEMLTPSPEEVSEVIKDRRKEQITDIGVTPAIEEGLNEPFVLWYALYL